MFRKLLVLLIALALIGFVIYQSKNQVLISSEKIVKQSVENFTQQNTVHGDIDVSMTLHVPSSKDMESKIFATSDIDLKDNSQKTNLNIGVNGLSIQAEVIVLKMQDMYMKMHFLGPNWYYMNMNQLKEDMDLPLDFQSNDYATQVTAFLKSFDEKSVTQVGEEEINGIRTTHYILNIDREKFIAYMQDITKGSTFADAFKDSTIKTEVWIDKKTNHLIQTVSNIENFQVTNPQNKQNLGTADMVIKIKYSKYNEPVEIKKPEGEIIPFSTPNARKIN